MQIRVLEAAAAVTHGHSKRKNLERRASTDVSLTLSGVCVCVLYVYSQKINPARSRRKLTELSD